MEITEKELKELLKVAFRYRFAYVGLRLQTKDINIYDTEEEYQMFIDDIKTLYEIVDKYNFDMGEFK